MTLDVQPRIAPDIVWRFLENNAVLVSPKGGEVRVLNAVGTFIWQMLVDNKSVADIVIQLSATYDVTRQRAQHDLLTFLEELTERGILDK